MVMTAKEALEETTKSARLAEVQTAKAHNEILKACDLGHTYTTFVLPGSAYVIRTVEALEKLGYEVSRTYNIGRHHIRVSWDKG